MLLLVGMVGCGADPAVDSACGGGEPPFVPEDGPACGRLSTYGMITLDHEGRVVPEPGVRPFRPATELFSDYAHKTRTVYVPPGTVVRYADGELEFPVGTVLTKTFAFPADLREPGRALRVVETRLLIRREHGWEAFPYVWNEDQTEAFHRPVGARVPVSWVHLDGEPRSTTFSVPTRSECTECHGHRFEEGGLREISLLGARARYLNAGLPGDATVDGVPVPNQLARWAEDGLLVGLPQDLTEVPRVPAWDDPDDGSLHARARAYLDANCGHCHRPEGGAGSSTALRLHWDERDPRAFGVCFGAVVVPGDPDGSRMVGRMSATGGSRMMPRIGRSVVHDEGVALIRQWIEWLASSEAAEALELDPSHYGCL